MSHAVSSAANTPTPMAPLAIRAHTATTALGHGLTAQAEALHARRSGLRRNDFGEGAAAEARLDTWIGRVEGVEDVVLPTELAPYDCRNNRLAWLALQQDGFVAKVEALVARHGAGRVAAIIGTSTSSIGASEEAYTRLDEGAFPVDLRTQLLHTPHSIGDFVRRMTGIRGPCVTVATACSSSAKVFAQAARLIHAGVVDAALVGGIDTLCGSVLFGFNSLGLVSTQRCQPFDVRRDGLSLGEAGGYAILERAVDGEPGLRLCGYGESSDAHHMSTPHPEGLGARLAMQDAIARAGIAPADVGYLNLHGTATPANDSVEAIAVAGLFGDAAQRSDGLHASSTKGWTGHTLGAAGIVESVFALIALEHGLLPGILGDGEPQPDPACGPQIRFANAERGIRYAMNNSFGFGGNNASLVFGRA